MAPPTPCLSSALRPTADGGSGLTRMLLEAVCGKLLPTRADLREFSESLNESVCVDRRPSRARVRFCSLEVVCVALLCVSSSHLWGLTLYLQHRSASLCVFVVRGLADTAGLLSDGLVSMFTSQARRQQARSPKQPEMNHFNAIAQCGHAVTPLPSSSSSSAFSPCAVLPPTSCLVPPSPRH